MENKMYNDLLQANRICKEATAHMDKAAQLYQEADDLMPIMRKKKTKNILLGVGAAYLASMVAMLPLAIPHIGPFLSLVLNFAGMAAGIYLGVTIHRRDKTALEARISQLSGKADAEQAAARKIFQEHEAELDFLPGEYWNPDATGYMLRALRSGRTQDLAVAMDLYDEYRHRRSLEETNRQILTEQRTQSSHLKSIKTSSKVNATANVANAVFNIASKF